MARQRAAEAYRRPQEARSVSYASGGRMKDGAYPFFEFGSRGGQGSRRGLLARRLYSLFQTGPCPLRQ